MIVNFTRGDLLSPKHQQHALRRYVHRFTAQHIPDWSKHGPVCHVQFESDADWLAHTYFPTKKDGSLASGSCDSHPTWPTRPDLRRPFPEEAVLDKTL